MRVEYRHFPPVVVFYARGVGPYESSSREAWRRMSDWLDQHHARKRVKQGFGFFRDDPKSTAPELLRYDACVPIMCCADLDPAPGIARQTLPGGAYAVHAHVGSYDEIGTQFSQLYTEVLPRRALPLDYDRPFMAVYLNDPCITRVPHRRTELCVPVLPLPMPAAGNDDCEQVADATEIARRIVRTG